MDSILTHTYYQLKCIFDSDMDHQRRHYLQLATAHRVSQSTEDGWKNYCREMQ